MQTEIIQLDVMSELRQRTREEHLALENLLPFFHADFSQQQYLTILERFFGIFEPLEPAIQVHLFQLDQNAPPSRATRTALIREDLLALGKSAAEIAALPRCPTLPTIQSMEQSLGSFYVLEGSMLGGQAISRELRNRFALTSDNGAAFFSSRAIDVKSRWLEDQKILRANLDTSSALDTAISSANDTFRAFKTWLTH